MRDALLIIAGVVAVVAARASVVVDGMTKLAVLFGLAMAVLGLGLLARRHRGARVVAAVVGVVGLIVALAPVRTDGDTLQAQMVDEVRRFEGVPYAWGGESPRGIDCSGLPRAARRAAAMHLAVTRFDPGLVRTAIVAWFVDVPAKGFLAGRGTVEIARAKRAELLPKALLRPGDLLCTADGTHVMVVLDENTVIEADPLPNRVIVAPMSDLKNPWMKTGIVAVRLTPP